MVTTSLELTVQTQVSEYESEQNLVLHYTEQKAVTLCSSEVSVALRSPISEKVRSHLSLTLVSSSMHTDLYPET